jgi:hypothetical protein
MSAREFALIVQETAYGTPVAVADRVIGTNAWYLRLSDPNSFSMQAVPIVGDIMYGGGLATPACAYSDQVTCTGQLSGVLYAGPYAKMIADWGLTQISSDRTAPWVTTDSAGVMPPTDLASVSIYHGIQRSDGTYDRRRYSGVKVLSGSITSSSQDRLAKFSLQIQGQRDDMNAAGTVAYPDATEFPFPTETDMPCNPYLFSHTSGLLKIASARTQYDSIGLAWTNTMAAKWFESKYAQLIKFCGRNTKLSANLYMKASPDDLASLKALTKLDVELSFNNGTNSLKFDLNTNNLFSQLGRDLPLNSTYSWNATVQNYYDGSTSSDVVVSST